MTLHPRHDLTTAAGIDIKTSVTEAIGRHPGLSHAELQHIFLGMALSWNKYAIRDEREEYPRITEDHPDYARIKSMLESGIDVCDSVDHNLERGCSNPGCFKYRSAV